jgi:predicted metal-dependent TIM-barrel fold hydrolase
MNTQPNQKIIIDDKGTIRFHKNKIVDKMLDFCTENGYSLNEIFVDFDNENDVDDYVQLMQLIGYSVSGYGNLSVVPPIEVTRADKEAERIYKSSKKYSNILKPMFVSIILGFFTGIIGTILLN